MFINHLYLLQQLLLVLNYIIYFSRFNHMPNNPLVLLLSSSFFFFSCDETGIHFHGNCLVVQHGQNASNREAKESDRGEDSEKWWPWDLEQDHNPWSPPGVQGLEDLSHSFHSWLPCTFHVVGVAIL